MNQAGAYGMAESDTLLILSDDLNQTASGVVTGGEFLASGGWKVSAKNAMIFYDLAAYISDGILEVTVSNFDPGLENTFNRHHVLSMYTNHWGEHHQVELLDTDWNLHTGFNYSNGVKLQAATYENNRDVVLPGDSLAWDIAQSYRLKFIWRGDSVQFFRNDTLFITNNHNHEFLLRYIFLGRDRTISGDYVTNYQNQQYPAMVGPVFSNLRVMKIITDSTLLAPQIKFLKVVRIYANAANLKWNLSEKGISRLIFRNVNSVDWHSTKYLGPPQQDFEYTIDHLAPGEHYEVKIIVKDEQGNTSSGVPIFFATRTSDYFLFKPIRDSFVEQAGIFGPTRDLANMGWLYLMVGNGRKIFMKFPPINSDSLAQRCVLRLHIRNEAGNSRSLRIYPVESAWSEDTVTWRSQPEIGDTAVAVLNKQEFLPETWVNFPIAINDGINNGLNVAITSSDSGWISFDSRESYFFQPELIIDYRTSYVFNGEIMNPRSHPISNVKVHIRSLENGGKLFSDETISTDIDGFFKTSLRFGEPYQIDLSRESDQKDQKAISIYDAYLTARLALGIDKLTPHLQLAADVNGDGNVTLYDALSIAKASVGLNLEGDLGDWKFDAEPVFSNLQADTVHLQKKGLLVGDVDFSWPCPNTTSVCSPYGKSPSNIADIVKSGKAIDVNFSGFGTQKIASFSVDFQINSNDLAFQSVALPDSMKNWFIAQNITDGRVQIALFDTRPQWVDLRQLIFKFKKRKNGITPEIVINKIQLDDKIYRNLISTKVAEKNKKKDKSFMAAFPNPFNESTMIKWNFPGDETENLYIFNQLGELVFSAGRKEFRGQKYFIWNGRDRNGILMPSAAYFILLKTKSREIVRKIMLLK